MLTAGLLRRRKRRGGESTAPPPSQLDTTNRQKSSDLPSPESNSQQNQIIYQLQKQINALRKRFQIATDELYDAKSRQEKPDAKQKRYERGQIAQELRRKELELDLTILRQKIEYLEALKTSQGADTEVIDTKIDAIGKQITRIQEIQNQVDSLTPEALASRNLPPVLTGKEWGLGLGLTGFCTVGTAAGVDMFGGSIAATGAWQAFTGALAGVAMIPAWFTVPTGLVALSLGSASGYKILRRAFRGGPPV
jgi:hypothetical protein